MAIEDYEDAATMTLPDPPEYSAEVGNYSPISVHFDGHQNPETPSPDFLSRHAPQGFPTKTLLSRRQSTLLHSSAAPSATKLFTYDVKKDGRTWAELKVAADETISKTSPTFIEGSRIEGQVSLYAAKAESIHSVIVSVSLTLFVQSDWRALLNSNHWVDLRQVKGQVITGTHASGQFTFFEVIQTVWSRAMGDPRKGNVHATAGATRSSSPHNEKLRGTFSWPFSLEMPREVIVSSKMMRTGSNLFRLPESYFERHGRASIRYEVCVRFVRGHFRSDDRIHATFNYIPFTIPEPPSPLRRLAYEQGSSLLGPRADPAGWYECRSIKLKGSIRRSRDVEVYCTLYLAKPLTYTRGSVIPCWLRLRSRDAEALESLANPKAIVARLQRCVKATADEIKAMENPGWRDQKELSELGIWWSSIESPNTREMSGELHLNIDLKPSSAMGEFRIEVMFFVYPSMSDLMDIETTQYSVVLFPFDTLAFEMVTTASLVEQPVEIVTGYAPGPRPRMYAPPDYESPDTVFGHC
ncbi:hypothetical protein NP233_g8318 [Leucocoprinus birnbaumii]|uniref:Arrestin-like N-terminal domain-containing protein n=1 Tax=Leucocoprinus birnbaumii TaxID=56174 RepID=A0AAD5VR43_9AGAR|nr:hypothetical protein NP233_g8318 [Leucocoprinus birnbaumii]